MAPTLGSLFGAFLVLSVVFAVLERLAPSSRERRRFRRGFATDVGWWFLTPLVTKGISRAAIVLAVVVLAVLAGVPLDREHVQAFATSGGVASRQPAWLQALEIVFLGDLVGYWMHRLFHGRRLWRYHAVHHSSTEVDWLSATRLHPVNDVVTRLAQVVPFVLLGFSPGVVAAYVPFLTFWAIFLHANVRWDLGPLRYVIASPAFHRWHHSAEPEAEGKNLAGLFPFIDLLFGTFHLPRRQPTQLGIVGNPVPQSISGQLLFPWRAPAA